MYPVDLLTTVSELLLSSVSMVTYLWGFKRAHIYKPTADDQCCHNIVSEWLVAIFTVVRVVCWGAWISQGLQKENVCCCEEKAAPIAALWSFERKTCDIKIVVVAICVGAWWLSLDWVLRWPWGVAVACNPATKHWTNFFFGSSDLLPKQKFHGLLEATCGLVGHYWPDPLPNKHSVVVNFNVCGMWCPSIMYVELRGTNFLPTNVFTDRGYRAESWWLLHCQYHWAMCSLTAVVGSLTLDQSCGIS